MSGHQSNSARRRWYLLLGGAGLACGVLALQAGRAQEPIGWMYHHAQDEYPFPTLGDVPEDENVIRSLADDRVRQFDELDRPRIEKRLTHRGTEISEEHFTVVATTQDSEADADYAKQHFAAAWEEFGKLADTFTNAHRNPDFAIGQIMIVIDGEALRDPEQPRQTVQIQNGQTVVYLNVAEGEPSLEEQLPRLREGAVQAMLHLAELDRKLPTWAQQGLAEYTAEKLEKAATAQAALEEAEAEEGHELEASDLAGDDPYSVAEEYSADYTMAGESNIDDDQPAFERDENRPAPLGGMNLAGGEYWRLKRAEPDRLQPFDEEEEPDPNEALERVRFLLEGEDAKFAPAFLTLLRQLAEEPTDPSLASRAYLSRTQLLLIPEDTVIDELMAEIEPQFRAWQADPLQGQPLFLPGGDIPDPAMLSREKEMEVVLKLAQKIDMQAEAAAAIRPRVTEFGADGQQEVLSTNYDQSAINVDQLYHDLTTGNLGPWATVDSQGQLLLWTDEERLAEVLGIDEQRYRSAFKDGRWVLVTDWDDATQLEAWLEENPANPSRPLVKFAAAPRERR